MSKYLGHFDVHYVEIWDNTYLDILDEEEKKILEHLGKCKRFGDYFSDYEFDSPPEHLYLKEISDEEAETISKYIIYCKSYGELIYDGLNDVYRDTYGKGSEKEGFTLEQVKEMINDTNS